MAKEHFLRALVENSPDGVALFDAEGRVIYSSQATTRLLGFEPDEVRGRPFAEFVHPEDLGRAQEGFAQSLRRPGAVITISARIRKRTGGWLTLEGHLSNLLSVPGVGAIINSFRDITGQRQAEDALRESEQQYRALVEEAPTGIFVNVDNKFVYVNAALCRILDVRKPEELLHQSVFDRAHPGFHEAIRQGDELVLRQGIARPLTRQRYLRMDGSAIEVETTATRVIFNGRSAVQVLVNDVTEREEALRALRESEAKYRALTEQSLVGVYVIQNQRFQYANAAQAAILGYTVEELLALPSVMETVAEEDRSQVSENIRRRLAGEIKATHYQISVVRKDGQRRLVEVLGSPTLFGGQPAVIGTALDMTERHQAEEALLQREEHFRLLIENGSDVITVLGQDGVIHYESPSVNRVLGYRPEELVSKHASEFIHPEDVPQVTGAIHRVLAQPGSKPVPVEYRFRRRNGEWCVLQSIGRVLPDQAKTLIVVNSRDITENRQLEAQLRQSQKMEAIGQLAGGVAHDFNNILTVIAMQAEEAELTAQTEQVCEPLRECLHLIRDAAGRAANLTRQLLLFSRRQVMQTRELDLNEAVTAFAKMLQRIIGEDIRLQLDLHPGALLTRADVGMLDQVLMNLGVNARDAMPAGGCLLIQTRTETVGQSAALLHPDATPGRYVCLSVSDTGKGIPIEVMSHIFEPFFTTKEPGKGTGLGLATVFGIVKQHLGWIKVESDPGKGAVFHVYLPASPEPATAALLDSVPALPRGGPETILLTEDEPAVRTLMRAVLRNHGYRVIEAATGPEAIRIWKEHSASVALLITDLVMPGGMSGTELARQLRHDQPGLKVVYTTGYSAEIAGQEFQLGQGEHFVQKPFTQRQLLETVRQCLDER